VSHQLSLDEAPEAYKHFDARENGWTKVVLRPEGKTSAHATGKPREERSTSVTIGMPAEPVTNIATQCTLITSK
jgi:hypothetical protein